LAGQRPIYDEAMASAANSSWEQNWPQAIRAYRTALEEFPNDAAALAGLGTAYFELAQYESAIRALQRALRADSTNQEAMKIMGGALEHLGRFRDAAKTYIYAGNVYAKAGQLDEAASIWEKAIEVDPDSIQARNNLIQAYVRLGKRALAVTEIITLAALYQEHDDSQKAKQYLQGALQVDADNTYARAALRALENKHAIRSVLQEMARTSGMEVETAQPEVTEEELLLLDLEEEEEAEPSDPREKTGQLALKELADVLFEDESQFDNQLSISKLEIDSYIGQAIDLQTRGRVDEAIKIYEQIIEAGFTHAAAYFTLASLHLAEARYEQAMTYLNQAKKDPNYLSGAHFALGECYQRLSNADQALRHFVEVLKISDLNNSHRTSTKELEQLYAALIDNYVSRGDDEATMAFVDSLVEFLSGKNWEDKIAIARRRLGVDDQDSVSAWIEFLEAGQAEAILSTMANTAEYIQRNILMTAAEECYRAIQQAPYYLPLHMRLAEIHLKQERVESAINKYLAVAEVYQVRENMAQVIAIYQKILKIVPMDVTVRSKLIDFYIKYSNIDAALEQYKILADAYYQLAQVDQSLEKYQEALKLAPRSSQPKAWQTDILYRMGDIYNQRVEWQNAVRVYEQLAKLSPEDDKALLQLVDLYFKLNQTDKAMTVLNGLMVSYNKQQKQAKMLQVLQDMVELRPQEFSLRKKLAAFYVQLGLTKQALAEYNTLGEMQLDAGLPDDAASTIETIIKLGPDDPDAYRRLLAQIRGGI
jgi:tetratricopeptide (TPR) repeat protein